MVDRSVVSKEKMLVDQAVVEMVAGRVGLKAFATVFAKVAMTAASMVHVKVGVMVV